MVDYSKWKNIEISDDEDDTHPNIDTPSLFRWRHQARVERMEQHQQELKELEKKKQFYAQKMSTVKATLTKAEKEGKAEEMDKLRTSMQELEVEAEKIKEKETEIIKKEKSTPWNVDTISNPGFTKTVINKKPPKPKDEDLSDEQREENMRKFVKENEKILKQFGMLQKFDDSKKFLQEHTHLVCENTANYLVMHCINLEMEGKHNLMEHVAHQCICMQYILELSKQLDVDPRACVASFFSRIQVAEVEYKASFDEELRQFKQRIVKRAREKVAEAEEEVQEEMRQEREKRLGPGGLDPVEVFETLPDELKQCFESQDVDLLQETIAKMRESDAVYHMKRCVDSGLWVPEGNKDKDKTKEPEEQKESSEPEVSKEEASN